MKISDDGMPQPNAKNAFGFARGKQRLRVYARPTLRHEVIDRSKRISILRSGPSAPNGGRSSVRMGVELDDTHTAAGHPSG
jgi:hypothetical protein